jgi:hypothetical protein
LPGQLCDPLEVGVAVQDRQPGGALRAGGDEQVRQLHGAVLGPLGEHRLHLQIGDPAGGDLSPQQQWVQRLANLDPGLPARQGAHIRKAQPLHNAR